jgi:Zn-dependent peptidase ImmA (M78 family)
MNAFERARAEAIKLRAQLLGSVGPQASLASTVLGPVEEKLNLLIERVPATYSELGGGSAVLKRNERAIYVLDTVDDATFAYLIAHELGHWILDVDLQPLTVAFLKELTGSGTSPAAIQVEAYGARERQELQANVFARELLLPRDVAIQLFSSGVGPAEAARVLGIPKEICRLQFLDAVFLPPSVPPRPNVLHPPSADQAAAAMAQERFANVVAGPGTGKTSTLVHRVRYLVEQCHVHPRNILVLTFTNKAAFELVERLRAAGIAGASAIWAGTFHAFGLEFLRKYHQKFDLPKDVYVADRLNVMSMLVRALPQADLKYFSRLEDPYEWLQPVINGIKRLKEELITPAMYVDRLPGLPAAKPEIHAKREDVSKLYTLHEAELRRSGMVDFVDLVALPATALKENRAPFTELVDGFHHVLVDEYQDVTQAMVELVRQLAAKAQTVWVVGDVRQAIHHWRGASVKSLLRFENTFSKSPADGRTKKFSLDINRRSSSEIVDLVAQVGQHHVLQERLPLDPYVSAKGKTGVEPVLVTCAVKTHVPQAVIAGVRECLGHGVSLGKSSRPRPEKCGHRETCPRTGSGGHSRSLHWRARATGRNKAPALSNAASGRKAAVGARWPCERPCLWDEPGGYPDSAGGRSFRRSVATRPLAAGRATRAVCSRRDRCRKPRARSWPFQPLHQPLGLCMRHAAGAASVSD